MTKTAVLLDFFSSFGMDAYPATAVPDNAKLPYISYEVKTDAWGGSPVAIGVSLWFKTDSEKIPNDKADEIGRRLGIGGAILPCDEGVVWIKKGTPFSLNQNANGDNTIKLRFLNLTLEFLTL